MTKAADNHPFAEGFLSESVRGLRGEVHTAHPSHVELARFRVKVAEVAEAAWLRERLFDRPGREQKAS